MAVPQGPTLLIPKLSHPDTVLIQLRPPLILTNDLFTVLLTLLFLTTCQCVIIPGHYFVRQILFVTFQTVCVAGAAQGMPLFHFAVTRGPRYLFQCITSYKNFSVILFIWRSFCKVLDYCIEVNISLLITIFKGAGNYCLPFLNTRHICWWTWIFFFFQFILNVRIITASFIL